MSTPKNKWGLGFPPAPCSALRRGFVSNEHVRTWTPLRFPYTVRDLRAKIMKAGEVIRTRAEQLFHGQSTDERRRFDDASIESTGRYRNAPKPKGFSTQDFQQMEWFNEVIFTSTDVFGISCILCVYSNIVICYT